MILTVVKLYKVMICIFVGKVVVTVAFAAPEYTVTGEGVLMVRQPHHCICNVDSALDLLCGRAYVYDG